MTAVLSYEEAIKIDQMIYDNLNHTDEDIKELYDDMIERAIRYAHIRAEWMISSREKRIATDSFRTSAHDAFIVSLNIVARTEGRVGEEWMELLFDDRKRIGDLACYLALFHALKAR